VANFHKVSCLSMTDVSHNMKDKTFYSTPTPNKHQFPELLPEFEKLMKMSKRDLIIEIWKLETHNESLERNLARLEAVVHYLKPSK